MSDNAREPYDMDPRFEACVLFYSVSDAKFWRAAGRELEADCLGLPVAKHVWQACWQINKENLPSSCIGVIQRLTSLVNAGKLDESVPADVAALFESVLDLQPAPPPAAAVLGEILPLLKRRLQSKAILQSHKEWSAGGTFQGVRETLAKAERLGHVEERPGVRVGSSGFGAISEVGALDRLPTGIFEVDQKIGGLWRQALGCWVGRAGGGKSIALTHQTATAIMQARRFTGFITLELPQSLQLARLYAHLTGVPVNLILDSEKHRGEAQARIEQIEGQLGVCELAEFPQYATTIADINAWVEDKEQQYGAKMDCLVVDYADLLVAPLPGKDTSDYLMMRYVYAGLRELAKRRNMFVWTASQSNGRDKQKENDYIGLSNVSDSMHKGRIADLMLTLNPREEAQLEVFVAKHRLGRADYAIGPLDTDFEHARLTPWVTSNLINWGV